jgi:type IV secretory pathway VirB10-like protein
MRAPIHKTLSTALLGASLLFTFACNRDGRQEDTARLDSETAASTGETAPAPDSEEFQSPRSTDIDAPSTEPTEPDTREQERADLEARERRVAERQAALDARERELRQRAETRTPPAAPLRRAETPRPAPRPAPEERAERPAERPDADTDTRGTAPAEPAEPEETAREERPEPEERAAASATVPSGTVLNVEFSEGLSSARNHVGDTFRTRVMSDITQDGQVVIPRGSEVLGEVSEAVPLKKIGGQAKLTLRFTDLVLPSGATVPIQASFLRQGRNETGRDAATIGGAAAGGAILGRVLGGRDRSRGTLVGAILGAAAGAVIASRTPGEEVVVPDGATVDLVLDQDLRVRSRDLRDR